jgi:hypothetical protein
VPPFERRFPHLVVKGSFTRERYRRPKQGFEETELPSHPPSQHAAYLRKRLDEARSVAATGAGQGAVAVPARAGLYLEFESEPGFDEFLERVDKKWVRLLNVTRTTA